MPQRIGRLPRKAICFFVDVDLLRDLGAIAKRRGVLRGQLMHALLEQGVAGLDPGRTSDQRTLPLKASRRQPRGKAA